MYKIVSTKQAAKTLRKLPMDRARFISGKIKTLASEPHSLASNVALLKGMRHCFRLRVGDWHVIYRVVGDILDILEIVPRGSAYR